MVRVGYSMSRQRRTAGGFAWFVVLSAVLFVAVSMVLRFIWLERATSLSGVGTIMRPADSMYFLSAFLIVLVSVAIFAQFRIAARPIALGFLTSILLLIHYYLVQPATPAADGLLIFLAYWFSSAVSIGLADGLVKSYALKGI